VLAILLTLAWHAVQSDAAHRPRIFYDSCIPWMDTTLCEGGMNWNPAGRLQKRYYQLALHSASIIMSLYFPGRQHYIALFREQPGDTMSAHSRPRLPIERRQSLQVVQRSKMQSHDVSIRQDGFHISGWRRYANGTITMESAIVMALNPWSTLTTRACC